LPWPQQAVAAHLGGDGPVGDLQQRGGALAQIGDRRGIA
jgi:hypothetical protein